MFGMQIGRLGRVDGRLSDAQKILALFKNGEQGFWLDPSDLSTLFQDAAGTTPVTAVEQPVGRMLDKSGRGNHATQATTTKRPVLSRRVNLLTKTEDFAGAEWNRIAAPGAGTASAPVVIANDDGQADKVIFNATGDGTSNLRRSVGYSTEGFAGYVRLKAATPADIGKIVAFRHASGGMYLLITLTSEYQVIGRNETAGSTYTGEFSLCVRPSVGASSGEVAVHLAYASLTLATDAHLPYQWVNTATDYDADPSKFPAYLRFDGVDDALQTGNIDFTSTDKMTVWAGVLRASTSLAQEICGLTASPVNAGAFTLWASTGADAGVSNTQAAFSSAISGSLKVSAQTLTHNTQAVLNGYQNITGVNSRLNSGAINTVAAIPVANFANAPIYIGSRAGTSSFLNGRLYSLIVRGAQTPLSQIEATELYVKQKMRMP